MNGRRKSRNAQCLEGRQKRQKILLHERSEEDVVSFQRKGGELRQSLTQRKKPRWKFPPAQVLPSQIDRDRSNNNPYALFALQFLLKARKLTGRLDDDFGPDETTVERQEGFAEWRSDHVAGGELVYRFDELGREVEEAEVRLTRLGAMRKSAGWGEQGEG